MTRAVNGFAPSLLSARSGTRLLFDGTFGAFTPPAHLRRPSQSEFSPPVWGGRGRTGDTACLVIGAVA